MLVGDVTTHQLHNLKPGTTYDLKVLAQYNTGDSAPLIGEGTTCKKMNQLFLCFSSKGSLFALKGYNVLIITHSLQCTWMWRTWPPTTWAMILFASDGPLTGQPPLTGWGSIPLIVSAALIYYKLRPQQWRIFELSDYATWQGITCISFCPQLPRVELRRSPSEAPRVATASMAWALTLFTTSQCMPKPPTWKGQEWVLRRGHVRRDLPCHFISKKAISHASRGFRNETRICLSYMLAFCLAVVKPTEVPTKPPTPPPPATVPPALDGKDICVL